MQPDLLEIRKTGCMESYTNTNDPDAAQRNHSLVPIDRKYAYPTALLAALNVAGISSSCNEGSQSQQRYIRIVMGRLEADSASSSACGRSRTFPWFEMFRTI